MIKIREEGPEDFIVIKEINDLAFGQEQESKIIDSLRKNCNNLLSIVGVDDGKVVGHIMFSPVIIDASEKPVWGMGLGPMAVLPEYQRKGIGSALVKEGISILRDRNCPFIILVGHPEYYPRFGFKKSSLYGIKCQWEVPEEAFMILVLDESAMSGVSGTAKYRDEFNEA